MGKRLIYSIVLTALLSSGAGIAQGMDEGLDQKKAKAAAYAAEITGMRSSLASNFIRPDAQVTEETFKSVCGAVGKRVKAIADQEGFMIRHATLKNRNPANEATAAEALIIERFSKETGLKELSDETLVGDKRFYRYTLPIYVEDSCLACHGPKDKRPAFIQAKYPNDRAYDYKKGELRGIISVLVPLN